MELAIINGTYRADAQSSLLLTAASRAAASLTSDGARKHGGVTNGTLAPLSAHAHSQRLHPIDGNSSVEHSISADEGTVYEDLINGTASSSNC